MNKIGVIGLGNVGLAIVHEFCVLNMDYEIIIVDSNRKKALSNIADFNDMLSKTKLKYGSYQDLSNCDIVIISVGIKNGKNRNNFLGKSYLMISNIMDNLNKTYFDGNIIVVSNPNDVLTTYVSENYYCYQKVIGTGCMLDINRLKYFLKRKDTNGVIIGEHGRCQKVIWDTFETVSPSKKSILEEKVINAAAKIVDGKGFTNYAIASCVVSLTKNILSNNNFNLVASFYDEKEKVAYSYPLICENKKFRYDEHFVYNDSKYSFISKIKSEYEIFKKGISIGIDLDDTITNIQSEMKKYAKIFDKENCGNGIINKDKYLVGEMYGWSIELRDKFFNTYRKKVISNAKIRNDVIKIFSKWQHLGYKIIIITARNSKYYLNPYMDTYNWLRENNIPFDKLVVESTDKKVICSELNINYYIDDMPNNCNKVNEISDTLVFIMDNGNNYGENKDIIRVKSFKEMDGVIENV